MRGDDLKSWLAVLGIGGGLALGGGEAGGQPPDGRLDRHDGERPRSEASQGPVYVVINHEEQYSIWPASLEPPRGWRVMHERIDLEGAVRRVPRIARQRFRVVINHEEQYSIWPRDRRAPKGFKPAPTLADREPCRIDECGRLLAELEETGGQR